MTRARKPAGRIAFVGAGPGDPGLLTMRAARALEAATVVVTDPDVPADVTSMAGAAEVKPAVGEPAEVAKALVTAAKSGQFVVRLVAGDVLTADPVVKELQSVSRSAVLFDVINPGLAAFGFPVPLGGTSNHFRTAVLRDIQAWDAWNVTEDADLGLRLARLGYAVEDLPSTTREEAPD